MSATILQFRPPRDRTQEVFDRYQAARWSGGMDSLPLIERSAFFTAALRFLIGVSPL